MKWFGFFLLVIAAAMLLPRRNIPVDRFGAPKADIGPTGTKIKLGIGFAALAGGLFLASR